MRFLGAGRPGFLWLYWLPVTVFRPAVSEAVAVQVCPKAEMCVLRGRRCPTLTVGNQGDHVPKAHHLGGEGGREA